MRIVVIAVSFLAALGLAGWVAVASFYPTDQTVETTGAPVAVTEETEFDFGVMNPYDKKQHSFFITNKGDAVLSLKKGGVSCSCTVGKIVKAELQPGDTTEVVVAWETEKWSDGFYNFFKVRTNDPKNEELKFVVKGEVMSKFAANNNYVDFGMLDPDEEPSGELLVYSQYFDDLKIDTLSSSWKGLTWTVEPAEKSLLLERNAKSGYLISLQGPSLTGGDGIDHWLRINGHSASQPDETHELEVDLKGQTRRSIAIYGDTISSDGVFEFKPIPQGEEFHVRLLVKIRGDHQDALFEAVKVEPSFVKATITKYEVGNAKGLFHLDINIPANAPVSYHRKEKQGKLTLISDHPTEPEVELGIDFQIYER